MRRLLKWRRASLDTRYPCRRCGEDFHVSAYFVPEKPAGRFLLWRWPARAAHWVADCASCGFGYVVAAEYDEPSEGERYHG